MPCLIINYSDLEKFSDALIFKLLTQFFKWASLTSLVECLHKIILNFNVTSNKICKRIKTQKKNDMMSFLYVKN